MRAFMYVYGTKPGPHVEIMFKYLYDICFQKNILHLHISCYMISYALGRCSLEMFHAIYAYASICYDLCSFEIGL